MANKLVNLAVTTTSWAAEFVTMNNSAEARAFLEVGGGGGSAVSSVNGQVGAVTLAYSDVGAASAAQGAKADTALQPGDASGAITSVNGKIGAVVLSASDVGAATTAQGAKADTALQPGDLPSSPVQSVNGKSGNVVLSASDVDAATLAQGAKADSAVQPGDLASVATTGSYNSLSGLPTLGTAAAQNVSTFATAAQGVKADTAVQPGSLAAVATTGTYASLTAKPTLGTAAATDSTAYATAAQGLKADTAAQASTLKTVATTGAYNDLTGKPILGTAAATDSTSYATAPGAWVTPTLVNGFANLGAPYGAFQYRVWNGVLQFRGVLQNSTSISSTTIICTLPSGSIPSSQRIIVAQTYNGSAQAARVDIYTDGSVRYIPGFTGSLPYLTLDGASASL